VDPQFKLEITSQYWLGPFEDGSVDTCSHGSIRAVIGGVVVTADEPEYGIIQSALALLRTLEQDHTPATRVTDYFLLCHGCGYPMSFGCGNFGSDWVVRHIGEQVVLTVATHRDATLEPSRVRFDAMAVVPADDYRREIVAFAAEARRFHVASGPRTVEDWEQDFHDRFWAEFDERLKRAEVALAKPPLTG